MCIRDRPWDGELRIFSAKDKIKPGRAFFLTDPSRGELAYKWDGEDLVIQVPEKSLDPIDTVIVLEEAT